MACAVMAFAGGLFGVVLGNAFMNEFYSAYPVNNRYWQVSSCNRYTISHSKHLPYTSRGPFQQPVLQMLLGCNAKFACQLV